MNTVLVLHVLAVAMIGLRCFEAGPPVPAEAGAASPIPAVAARRWAGLAALAAGVAWIVAMLAAGPVARNVHGMVVVLTGLTGAGAGDCLIGLARMRRSAVAVPRGEISAKREDPLGGGPMSRVVVRWTPWVRALGVVSVPLVWGVGMASRDAAAWWDEHALPVVQAVALWWVPWAVLAAAGTVWAACRRSRALREMLVRAESGVWVWWVEGCVPPIVRPCVRWIDDLATDPAVRDHRVRVAARCDARLLRVACAVAARARTALNDEARIEARPAAWRARGISDEVAATLAAAARAEAEDRIAAARAAEGAAAGSFPAALELARSRPSPDDGPMLASMTAAVLAVRLLGAHGKDVSVTDVESALADPAVATGPARRVVAAARVLLEAHAVPAAWSPVTGWDPAVLSAIRDGGPAGASIARAAALVAECRAASPWRALGELGAAERTRAADDFVPVCAGAESRLLEADARRDEALARVVGRSGWDLVRAASRRSSVRAARAAWTAREAAGDPVACNAFNAEGSRSSRGLAPVRPARVLRSERAELEASVARAAADGRSAGAIGGTVAAGASVFFGLLLAGVSPSPEDFVPADDLRVRPAGAAFESVTAVAWDAARRRWLAGGADGSVSAFDPERRAVHDPGLAAPDSQASSPVRGLAIADGRTWVLRDGSLVAYGPGGPEVVSGRAAPDVADRAEILAATEFGGRWLVLFGGAESGPASLRVPHLASYDPSQRDWNWSIPIEGDPGRSPPAVAGTVGAIHVLSGTRLHVLGDQGDHAPGTPAVHDLPPAARIADVASDGQAALCGDDGSAWVATPAGVLRTVSAGGFRPPLPASHAVVPSDGWWWVVLGGDGDVVPVASYLPATRAWGAATVAGIPSACTVAPAVSPRAAAFAARDRIVIVRPGPDGVSPEPLSRTDVVVPVTSMTWVGADLRVRTRDGHDVLLRGAAEAAIPRREDRGGASVPVAAAADEVVGMDDGLVLVRDRRGAVFVYDERLGVWHPAASLGLPSDGVARIGGGGASAWLTTTAGDVVEFSGRAVRTLRTVAPPAFGPGWTAAATASGLHVRDASGRTFRYDAMGAEWHSVTASADVVAAFSRPVAAREGVAGARLTEEAGEVRVARPDASVVRLGEGRAAWIRNDDAIAPAAIRGSRAWVAGPGAAGGAVPAKLPWDEVVPLGSGWFADAAGTPSWICPPGSAERFAIGGDGFGADRFDRVLRDGLDVLVRTADGWFSAPAPLAPLAQRRRAPIPASADRVQAASPDGAPAVIASAAADGTLLARTRRADWRRARGGLIVTVRDGGAVRPLGASGFDGDLAAEVFVSDGRTFRIDDAGVCAEDGGPAPGGGAAGLRLVRNGEGGREAILSADPSGEPRPDPAGGPVAFLPAPRIRGAAVPRVGGAGPAAGPFTASPAGGFLRDRVEDCTAFGPGFLWRTQGGVEIEIAGLWTGVADAARAAAEFRERDRRRSRPVTGLGWTLAPDRGRLRFVPADPAAPLRVREFARGRFADDEVVSLDVRDSRLVVRSFHAPLVPLVPGSDPADGGRDFTQTAVSWPVVRAADGSLVPSGTGWAVRTGDGEARFRWREGP